MKKYIVLLVCITTIWTAQAGDEPFQGTVNYTVKYEGEGSEYMGMFSFSDYQYTFGDKKVRLKLIGGMAYLLGDFVIDHNTGKSLMIDDGERIAYTMPDYEESTADNTDMEVVKTKEKEKILGYKCIKYYVATTVDSSDLVMEYWTTTKINVNAEADIGMTNNLLLAGVEGFPLRIVSYLDGITMTQEASSIDETIPDQSRFEAPSDYQVKDFSESPLMKMMEGAEGEE